MTDSKPPEPRAEQENQRHDAASEEKSELSILLFAGGIALFGLVLGLILDWYIDPQTSTQKKDLVQALGLITAGVAGAVGIFFTWRGQRLARETQEHNQRNTQEQLRLTRQSQEQNQKSTQAQLENAQEELRLTRQGQITERFTRAIDQLGATDDKGEKKLEIRLGGIYALERIDKESPERAYHGTVMEVLTAYVRENSRRDQEKPFNEDAEQEKGVEQQGEEPPVRSPPVDIQAILDVLNRREEDHIPEQHRVRLDLQEANLFFTNLSEANLLGANLYRANLYRAILQGAYLYGARLQGTRLEGVNLQGANLGGANLEGTVDLAPAQIEDTLGNKFTKLPEDLHPPAMWSKNLEEQKRILQKRSSGSE
jgi:Pentapeptide repeats (8 copies)